MADASTGIKNETAAPNLPQEARLVGNDSGVQYYRTLRTLDYSVYQYRTAMDNTLDSALRLILMLVVGFRYSRDAGGSCGQAAHTRALYHSISSNLFQKLQNQDVVKYQFVLNDVNIPTTNVSAGTFDVGFGAYFNTDKLFAGISASHLNQGKINFSEINTKMIRHYYLMAGYGIDLTSSLTLKPMIQLKSDAVSTQIDANANLMINNRFWIGGSYRIQDAIVLLAGLEIIPNLRLGYSYDLTTSDIKTYSSGTHEIMLGYCYKPNKIIKRQFHRNVRFL